MIKFPAAALCISLGLLASGAMAQDAMKAAPKDGMMKAPTMQECKDHMAMSKKDAMKADDASMKMDKACADMMKKDDAMKSDGAMKSGDAMAPMKK